MNLMNTNLRELREKLDTKKIGAVELAKEYTENIKKYNPKVLSYITVTEDEALSAAKKAQEKIDKGESTPLCGIPCGIKDNICTNGITTTCASKMLENFVPPYDATVIEKLKAENYVLLGKNSMDEFAMGGSNQTSAFAKTKNPYDLSRVPGGSSGGGACAVGAGLAPYTLGSDTGGSIRQPAAFCGVTGLKPSYGRVSRYGLVAFASSLDQIGPIANNAHDCAVVLNAISGRDERDATSKTLPKVDFTSKIGESIKGLKIAIPREFFGDAVDSEIKEAVMNAAHEYEKLGAVLVDCSMKALKYAVPAYYLIACAEAASNLSRYDGIKYGLKGKGNSYEEQLLDSRNNGFGDEVKRRILLGNYALSSGYYDAYYRKALALKQEIKKEYDEIFKLSDVILTPTSPSAAYKIGEDLNNPVKMYMADICTVTVNIASLPGISTTCGYTGEGMPIGMSLIGKMFDEETIIQTADIFEKNFDRKPPNPALWNIE